VRLPCSGYEPEPADKASQHLYGASDDHKSSGVAYFSPRGVKLYEPAIALPLIHVSCGAVIQLGAQVEIDCGGGASYIYMAMEKAIRPKLGRPRKFNEETAVEAAMLVFWEKGYEGASLRDLTEAMGIDRKSMYLTLGDKESLFKKVLDRYNMIRLAFVPRAFAKPTLREFVDDLLNSAIQFWVAKSHPGTCMTIQNLAVSDESEPIRRAMAAWRKWRLGTFRERIERARKEGDLPPELKPEAFARYLSVILAGLAVQASSGATLGELKRTIAMFRQTMPIPMDIDSRP
jgi:AcrR family transcriptional regulator